MEKQTERSLDFVRLVGGRLRDARVALGLSQAELGKRLNLTPTAVGNYESGASEMPLGRLPELASALKVTVDSLVAPPSTNTERIEVYVFPEGVLVVSEATGYGWTTMQVLVHPDDTWTAGRIKGALKSTHKVVRLTHEQVEALPLGNKSKIV